MRLEGLAGACAVAGLVACARPAGNDLGEPVASHELPAELAEISGLSDLDEDTLACVQDELGIVYSIDLRTGAVVERRPFGPDGDYEGLARVGDHLWVLRSDGALLELEQRDGALAVARTIDLDVGHDDLEGLAYDPVDEVLLVAAKDSPDGGKEARDRRRIFAVDPTSDAPTAREVLTLSLERIVDEATALGIELPRKRTAKGRERVDFELRFASISVHPSSGDYYLLSSADRAVVVVDRQGTLLRILFLDAGRLPKPEGIVFLDAGDIVIASEGAGGPARIERFQSGAAEQGRRDRDARGEHR